MYLLLMGFFIKKMVDGCSLSLQGIFGKVRIKLQPM